MDVLVMRRMLKGLQIDVGDLLELVHLAIFCPHIGPLASLDGSTEDSLEHGKQVANILFPIPSSPCVLDVNGPVEYVKGLLVCVCDAANHGFDSIGHCNYSASARRFSTPRAGGPRTV